MKTILWAQNEDAMIKDTFIIDGNVTHASDTTEERLAFSALTRASESLKISPKARRIFSELLNFSEQANFSIEGNSYYFQGCFTEKDNAGRDMPYMFLTTECSSFDDAVNKLKTTSALIGRHCNEVDLKLITSIKDLDRTSIEKSAIKLSKIKESKANIMILAVVAVLITLIFVIWKMKN